MDVGLRVDPCSLTGKAVLLKCKFAVFLLLIILLFVYVFLNYTSLLHTVLLMYSHDYTEDSKRGHTPHHGSIKGIHRVSCALMSTLFDFGIYMIKHV